MKVIKTGDWVEVTAKNRFEGEIGWIFDFERTTVFVVFRNQDRVEIMEKEDLKKISKAEAFARSI